MMVCFRYTLGDGGVLAVTPYTAGEHDTWFNIQMAVPYHTLKLMGANPEWAPPNGTHLLRSTSVVTRVHVALSGDAIEYTTFDARGVERLRVAPAFLHSGLASTAGPEGALSVSAGGVALPRLADASGVRRRGAVGWAYDAASGLLAIARNASDVRVLGGALA